MEKHQRTLTGSRRGFELRSTHCLLESILVQVLYSYPDIGVIVNRCSKQLQVNIQPNVQP